MPKIPDETVAPPIAAIPRSILLGIFLLIALPSPLHAELLPWTASHQSVPHQSTPPPSLHYEFNHTSFPDPALPVPLVFVGDPVDGLTPPEIRGAIESAARTWNDVACAPELFRWGGFRETLDEVTDDELPVYFQTGTGDLAARIAWTIMSPSGTGPAEMAVVLNHPGYHWALQPHPFASLRAEDEPITVEISSVLTHEFGHALGLAHTNAHNAATMAARYLPDGSQITLSADDKIGLCRIYSAPGDECDDDSQCPGASCVSDENGNLCDIPLGRVGDYCGLELSHCPDYCHFDEPELGMGYCSTTCDSDADCPDHFRCTTPPNFISPVCIFEPDPDPPQSACSTTSTHPLPLFAVTFLLMTSAAMRRRRS